MTITPSRKQAKTKTCPKCKDTDQLKSAYKCSNCGNPFKPRLLQYGEIEDRLKQIWGTEPKLNIRTNEVWIGEKHYTADAIERAYLKLSNVEEQFPIKPTSDAIWEMAEANKFDPIKIYLDGLHDHSPLPMELWQRLDKYLLGIDNPAMADFLPQFFVGAIARIYQPGCEARCTPVLVSRNQEIGKSTLGRILFSGDNQDYWVEGVSENLDKDVRLRCQSAWACELAELDGVTRRSDVAALKAFLTERTDSFRKPYGKGVERFPRNFVFWGTSNEPPLRDLTGNSRFLCVELPNKLLPLDWALAQRNALWARAIEQYQSGFEWNRPTDQQRADRIAQNSNFEQIDPWIEELRPRLERDLDEIVPLSDLYEVVRVSKDQQSSVNARRIRLGVESLGWRYGVHKERDKYSSSIIQKRGFKISVSEKQRRDEIKQKQQDEAIGDCFD
jgi:predicted P-loop ATPase